MICSPSHFKSWEESLYRFGRVPILGISWIFQHCFWQEKSWHKVHPGFFPVMFLTVRKSPSTRYILDFFRAMFLTGKVPAKGTSWILQLCFWQEKSQHKVHPGFSGDVSDRKSPSTRFILDFPAMFLTGKVQAQGTSWIFRRCFWQEESKHEVYPRFSGDVFWQWEVCISFSGDVSDQKNSQKRYISDFPAMFSDHRRYAFDFPAMFLTRRTLTRGISQIFRRCFLTMGGMYFIFRRCFLPEGFLQEVDPRFSGEIPGKSPENMSKISWPNPGVEKCLPKISKALKCLPKISRALPRSGGRPLLLCWG